MIKRHHPITVVYKLYRQMRYSIIPLAAFLFNEVRAGTGQQPYWIYIVTAVYGVAVGFWSILSWYRETYQLDSKVLRMTKGVFNVTQRTIPLMKISNIQIEQSWMYRLIGVANVELQTRDSNSDADARLVTSRKVAKLLKGAIRPVGNQRVISVAPREHHVTQKEIMMLSMSSNTFWLGLPVTTTVIQRLWNWLYTVPEEEQASFTELFEQETWSGISPGEMIGASVFLGISVIVTWLFSIGMAQFRYRGWHISRTGDMISVHHGWVGRKSAQVYAQRIQSLRIKELMFGRLFGYAAICMDCVGYRGERRMKLLIPSIKKTEMKEVLNRLVPEFQLHTPEQSLHRSAKNSALLLPLTLLLLGILIGCYFTLWFIIASLLLYITYGYISYVSGKSKWDIHGNLLVLRKAGINQTTAYLLRKSIESISVKQSSWLRLFRIYQLETDIDSPANIREYPLTGITRQDIDEILGWYKKNHERGGQSGSTNLHRDHRHATLLWSNNSQTGSGCSLD